MGRKDTSFGLKYQKLLVRIHEIIYYDIFVVAQIYISYVVISIIPITFMLTIEGVISNVGLVCLAILLFCIHMTYYKQGYTHIVRN